jgi:hypothetical protein
MPDSFGFSTPQEIVLSLRTKRLEAHRKRSAELDRADTATQAGAGARAIVSGIGSLFGRKPKEDPLVTRAKLIQEQQKGIMKEAQTQVQEMGVHEDYAQANAHFQLADRLAEAGFMSEADQTRSKGMALMKSFRDSAITRSNVKSQMDTRDSADARAAIEAQSSGDVFYFPGEQRLESIATDDLEGRKAARAEGAFEANPSTVLEGDDVGLTTKTKGTLEDNIFESQASLDRLGVMREMFDPTFQTFAGRAAAAGIEIVDRISPEILDAMPSARKFKDKFDTFRTVAFTNMNLYIKMITGAQMSNAEADRLRKGIPDPERDGPGRFVSKMDGTQAQLEALLQRAQWVRAQGFDDIPWLWQDAEGVWQEDKKHPSYRPIEDFVTIAETEDIDQPKEGETNAERLERLKKAHGRQ